MAARIVHIITRMVLGGAQENTLLTCEGLHRSRRWHVTLVTGPAIGPEGELIRRARRCGIHTIVVPDMQRAVHPVRDARALASLVSITRRLRPDLVHTHSSKAGVLGRVAARACRVPAVVHTIHGLPFHPYQKAAYNALCIAAERLGARCSDRLVCVADAMRRQALDAGVGSPHQYVTIYSGMEVDAFLEADRHRERARRAFGFAEEDVVIGKIARLFHLKGHRYVLEAAPRIIQRCPRARFLFVGDGILRETLQRQAARIGVADRVVFAGLVDAARIPEMIGAMDIVVHASLREGLPRAVVQALLGGRAVVCYAVDGAPEVVLDGVTGRLVPPRSVEELADAVVELAADPARARRMAFEARRRFTDRFRAETMVRELETLYCSLLAAKSCAPPV